MTEKDPGKPPPRVPLTVSEWFYIQRGVIYGPVTSTDLRAAAHLGFLGPEDMVCRKDSGTWTLAESVPGLFYRPSQPQSGKEERPSR